MTFDNKSTRLLALLACLAFLFFGLARFGLGAALIAQGAGLIDIGELGAIVVETSVFLEGKADRAIIAFSVSGYFAYIAAMGVVLSAGAIEALRRRVWGVKLIALYLAMHAALFLNYLTINPKIWLVFVGLALLGLIALFRKPVRS